MVTFGDRIRSIRYGFGINQERIAESCGTSLQNVSKWEWGTFQPSASRKKSIAKSFRLSEDWLISGSGLPFAFRRVIRLAPVGRRFEKSLALIEEALGKARRVDTLYRPYKEGDVYYALLLYLKEPHSILIFHPPLGYDRAFHDFLSERANVYFLGELRFPDSRREERFKSSFREALRVFQGMPANESDNTSRNYFYVGLYNARREDFMGFIFSRAKTIYEKLEGWDKRAFDLLVPDALSVYRHHHGRFKEIVRKWLRKERFSEREKSIIREFALRAELPAGLELRKRDLWEAFLIKGIRANRIEPFGIAYAEILSLMLDEAQGIEVPKPSVDEEKDRLFWP